MLFYCWNQVTCAVCCSFVQSILFVSVYEHFRCPLFTSSQSGNNCSDFQGYSVFSIITFSKKKKPKLMSLECVVSVLQTRSWGTHWPTSLMLTISSCLLSSHYSDYNSDRWKEPIINQPSTPLMREFNSTLFLADVFPSEWSSWAAKCLVARGTFTSRLRISHTASTHQKLFNSVEIRSVWLGFLQFPHRLQWCSANFID